MCTSPMNEETYVQKLRLLEETHGTPMQHWRAATVLAWLEITMDMPQYGAQCAENIKSGKVRHESFFFYNISKVRDVSYL